MSDHNERACPDCGSFLHYSCKADAALERTYGVKYAPTPAPEPSSPAEEVPPTGDPTFDPLTGEEKWDGFREGRIQNFLGLAWAGRKLAEYERGLAQNAAAHAQTLQFIEEMVAGYRAKLLGKQPERFAELQAPLQKQADFFRAAIDAYARPRKAEILIGRKKSRELPDSGIQLVWHERKEGSYRLDQRPGADGKPPTPAENKAALLAWLRDRGLASAPWVVAGPEAPDVAAVKDYLSNRTHDPGAAPPPGLEYVPPGETLEIVTPKPAEEK